jgi:GT2 family glycosyltransferase
LSGQPQLSIIIVNHRAEAVLPECLEAISSGDHDLSVEVIIVNNPPGETIDEGVFPAALKVRSISTLGRIGFGAACNLGVSESSGEYVLFLNPDVILNSAAIGELSVVVDEKSPTAIAIGRLVGPDGRFQPSCRRFPTLSNLFFSRGSVLYKLFGIGGKGYTLSDYSEVTEVEAAAAAMMMMSRKDFDRLSGFDESFFLYMEDTDFCYRAAQAGLKIFYVPGATGKHYWGYSTRHYRFRRIIWHHRSIWKYFVRHHKSIPTLACLGPLLLLNCLLSLLAEFFTLPT